MRDALTRALAHCATIAVALGEFAGQAAPATNALRAPQPALCESRKLPHRLAFDRATRFFPPREARSSERSYWVVPDGAVRQQFEQRYAAPRAPPAPEAVPPHPARMDLKWDPYVR